MANGRTPKVRVYVRERGGKRNFYPPTKPGLGRVLLAAVREGRKTMVATRRALRFGCERKAPPRETATTLLSATVFALQYDLGKRV